MKYNRYRHISITAIFTFIVFSGTYLSCIKDTCSNTICNNGGVCVNGNCACPTGFEGEQCSDVWNAKFTGTWHAADVYFKDTAHRRYDIQITTDTLRDSFYINGFADTLNKILCLRTSYNNFSMINEQFVDSNLTIKSGNGTLDATGHKVTGVYSFKNRDTIITSSFTWVR
jgi:hypothetical protein